MSRHNEKITRLYLGELPLIKNVIERLGLKEIFAKYIKTHKNEKIPAVDSLMMLLFNITCGRQPLYELEEWVEHINPRIFGHHSFKKGIINDDRFGKALDKLYMADRATMMTQIVISMVKLTNLDLSRIHNDSTTVKAYGKIPGRTRTGLKLQRGHSKDYRPDLKQIVYNLTISADGAVPVHYKTYEGSRTDDTTHIETWNTLCQIAGKSSFLYVADSKVCTRKQLSHIVGHGGRVVTISWSAGRHLQDSADARPDSHAASIRRQRLPQHNFHLRPEHKKASQEISNLVPLEAFDGISPLILKGIISLLPVFKEHLICRLGRQKIAISPDV